MPKSLKAPRLMGLVAALVLIAGTVSTLSHAGGDTGAYHATLFLAAI